MSAELTPREREVAELVARGYTRKGVSRALGIEVSTVDVHLRNIAAKLPGHGSRVHRITVHFLRVHSHAA